MEEGESGSGFSVTGERPNNLLFPPGLDDSESSSGDERIQFLPPVLPAHGAQNTLGDDHQEMDISVDSDEIEDLDEFDSFSDLLHSEDDAEQQGPPVDLMLRDRAEGYVANTTNERDRHEIRRLMQEIEEETGDLGFNELGGAEDEDSGDSSEDELDAPKLFDETRYSTSYQELSSKIESLGHWLHGHLVRFEERTQTFEESYRFEHIYRSWVQFLAVHESLMKEARSIVTRKDRSPLVCYGSMIFCNLLQLHVLKTVQKLIEGKKELRRRFQQGEDDAGATDVRNYETLQDEPEGIRLLRIRVTHLGADCGSWGTPLLEEEYELDQELQKMTDEEWAARVRAAEGEERWKTRKGRAPKPYTPKERVKLPRHKTVVEYTQLEVTRALKLITRYIDTLSPTAALRDFFQALMWRNGLFFVKDQSKDTLDDEKHRTARKDEDGETTYMINRIYCFFTYYYSWAIMRRWYYYDLYDGEENEFVPRFRAHPRLEKADIRWLIANQVKRTDPRFVARSLNNDSVGVTLEEIKIVKDWIQGTLFPSMGMEGFNQKYEQTMEEAYRFSGDLDHFKVIEPRRPKNTATVLAYARQEDPDARDSFVEEGKVSIQNIINSVGTSHINDLFVFNSIDAYFRMHISQEICWRDTFVVESDWLQGASFLLSNSPLPFMVQIFSKYWIMVETRLYRTKTNLEALALWFKLMDRWYDGALEKEDKSNGEFVVTTTIKPLLDSIWRPQTRYADLGDGIHDRPL